jgi:hypothetical protein
MENPEDRDVRRLIHLSKAQAEQLRNLIKTERTAPDEALARVTGIAIEVLQNSSYRIVIEGA